MSTKVRETKPATYYEDVDWKDAHLSELTEEYPNEWIAVSEGGVVAADPELGKAMRRASQTTGRDEDEISVFFICGLDMIL